tara:strand:- start:113 stop:490 length:378 start_codon:yes stop_codon:yes gene_type:complete
MPNESISVTPAIPTGSQPVGSVKRPPASPEVSPFSRDAQPKEVQSSESVASSREDLEKAIEDVQIMMELRNRSVTFSRDEEAGAEVIKVIDSKSGDVIRQMPSEELLTFMRNLTRMLGTFVSKEA